MDMGVGVVVPMRMPVVMIMGMAVGVARRMTVGMVVMMGVGRGGNHVQDVIL